MSGHPRRCDGCHGSGWADGPPIVETIAGRQHLYATVVLCQHPWWQDDHGWSPEHDEPMAADHPRAIAAFERGYARGKADLAALRAPAPGRAPTEAF